MTKALGVIGALLFAGLAAAWKAHVSPRAAGSERMRLAERIYREGVLPSGRLLRALRPGGGEVAGTEAACVQCHRRSGMGAVEGSRVVPPITGPFLFQPRAQSQGELDGRHTRGPDLARAFGRNRWRAPYTDESVARAIREGIDSSGSNLEPPMPRYVLDDSEAELLIDYLKQLSNGWSPGVTRDTLHFATVVAPGVDPARRQAMLDVLEAFFTVRNAANRLTKMRERSYTESARSTYRAWQLHVWDLTGAPETWQAQLLAHEQRQPVFALLSGVSEGAWAPVHEFCEQRHVPCWFPTVDLPEGTGGDFYSVYFSKGIILEAEILAHQLSRANVRRVIEIRGHDAAAAGAAQALKRTLKDSGIRIEEIDAAALREAAAGATAEDALVFWLRADDLARLAQVPAPRAPVYFSATLAGGDHAPIPLSWKPQARLLYPFELPAKRLANLARFHAWLETRGLKLVDERLQADAYLASQLMSEKVDEMLENLHRDYLLERAEAILGMRVTTAMYHRLSLGPGQRFASKGGYITRFAMPDRNSLVAETSWVVP